MDSLPNEILLVIFDCLPLRELLPLSGVCSRWKILIDSMSDTEEKWTKYCLRDYKTIAQKAKLTSCGLSYSELYRNLSMWRTVRKAKVQIDAFAESSQDIMSIRNFTIDNNGIMTVLRKNVVDYYEIDTLNVSKKYSKILIQINTLRYECNYDTLVLLDRNFKLHVKMLSDRVQAAYENVRGFALVDKKVYFFRMNGTLFVCEIINGKLVDTPICLWDSENVLRLSHTDKLHILVSDGNIFSYNGKLEYMCTIQHNTIFNLVTYNMLNGTEQKTLKDLFSIFPIVDIYMKLKPLREVSSTYVYGDYLFIGTRKGTLLLYLMEDVARKSLKRPLKEWVFVPPGASAKARSILCIEVRERPYGHLMFVSTSEKIYSVKITNLLGEENTEEDAP